MHLETVIPHLPSDNIQETIDFFLDLLGFDLTYESENYTELQHNNHRLGILKAIDLPPEQSIYFKVRNIHDW